MLGKVAHCAAILPTFYRYISILHCFPSLILTNSLHSFCLPSCLHWFVYTDFVLFLKPNLCSIEGKDLMVRFFSNPVHSGTHSSFTNISVIIYPLLFPVVFFSSYLRYLSVSVWVSFSYPFLFQTQPFCHFARFNVSGVTFPGPVQFNCHYFDMGW